MLRASHAEFINPSAKCKHQQLRELSSQQQQQQPQQQQQQQK